MSVVFREKKVYPVFVNKNGIQKSLRNIPNEKKKDILLFLIVNEYNCKFVEEYIRDLLDLNFMNFYICNNKDVIRNDNEVEYCNMVRNVMKMYLNCWENGKKFNLLNLYFEKYKKINDIEKCKKCGGKLYCKGNKSESECFVFLIWFNEAVLFSNFIHKLFVFYLMNISRWKKLYNLYFRLRAMEKEMRVWKNVMKVKLKDLYFFLE